MDTFVVTDNFIELILALTTNLSGMLILGMLTVYSLRTFSVHNHRNHYLYLLFSVSFVELCTHLFTTVIQYKDFFGNNTLGVVLYSSVFVVNSFYLIAWLLYLNDHMRKFANVDSKYRIGMILLSVPVGLLLVLSILNIFLPVFFSFDGFEYIRLPGYYLTLLIPIGYLLYGFFLFLRSKHKRRIYQQLPFVALLLPIVLAHIAESRFIHLCCIPLANTITLMMLVLTNVKHRSSVDAMTGLYSRGEFYHVMDNAIAGKQRIYGVMMDLDHFKSINDTYGHLVGDDALSDFSHVMKTSMTGSAVGFRYAGDEFIMLLLGGDEAAAKKMVERFYSQLASFNATSKNVYTLSVSYGMASFRENDDVNSFIARMDHRMYANKMSKRSGEKTA